MNWDETVRQIGTRTYLMRSEGPTQAGTPARLGFGRCRYRGRFLKDCAGMPRTIPALAKVHYQQMLEELFPGPNRRTIAALAVREPDSGAV